MCRGYQDNENMGKRYNVYNLDYGTFAMLIGHQPPLLKTEFSKEDVDSRGCIFPFGTERFFPKIILTEEIFQVSKND
jgi:hypothetical protein